MIKINNLGYNAGIHNYERRSDLEKEKSFERFKVLSQKYMGEYSLVCIEIIEANKERFISAPGSNDKHQPWEGGYMDHIEQLMRYSIHNYNQEEISMLPRHEQFSLEDALLVIFLHDIEKPFKYIEPKQKMKNEYALRYSSVEEAQNDNLNKPFESGRIEIVYPGGTVYFPSDKEIFAEQNGIKLKDIHRIALHYVHGEIGGTYDKSIRVQSPLGAFAGNADRYSARVMFNMGYDADGNLKKYSGPNLDGQHVGDISIIKNFKKE